MTALEVRGLSVRFRDVTAVDGVDLRVEAGECLALVGESGSGKSVTARTLLGLTQREGTVSAGRLDIAGHDARRWRQRHWRAVRGRDIGFVLQNALGALDPLRRIGQELAEALRVHRTVEPEMLPARMRESLAEAGVEDASRRLRQYPHELSGGLRQRALIATALAARPAFLIADEPTTALDATVQQQILRLLRDIRDAGTGLLLISHDLAVVASVADRVAVMRAGRVVEEGPTAAVLGRPRHAYTRQLLRAIPSAHPRGERLTSVDFDLSPARSVRAPAADAMPLATVTGVHRRFAAPGGPIVALAGVDLVVPPAGVVGIVGESGSGKSTLARVLLGLERPDEGSVVIRPTRPGAVQAVFQDPLGSFDPRYTVRRVLDEALEVGGIPRADRADAAGRLLDAVGLPGSMLSRRPLELSGGQQQRVAIARALAPDPDLIVCDEPVSALDVSVQAQILDLLLAVRRELGVALVFVSHDLGVVHHVSDQVLVMHAGRVVESGPADAVFARPEHPRTRELLAAVPRLPSATTIA